MRKLIASLVLVSVAGLARADEPRPHGELRVFFYDASQRPFAPPPDARIYVEPKAGGRRVLRPTLLSASAPVTSEGLHHGGQIQRLRSGETIELEIIPPDAAPVASATQPYLVTDLDLLEYVCPMKCAVDVKPGDCPKCGMEMKPSLLEFDAVVALKVGSTWENAKGFHFPSVQPPKSLREAVDRLAALAAEIKTRVTEGKLDGVHTPALGAAEIGKLLHDLAVQDKVDDTAVAPIAARLAALGPELDRTADAGHAADTSRLLAELQSRVETLRGLVK